MTTERAILAGGCFWGMQDFIRKLPGVISTRVGYTGGDVPNATYRNHGTHAEAIEIMFDPSQTSYRRLLEFFFQIHDPTTLNRQGNDVERPIARRSINQRQQKALRSIRSQTLMRRDYGLARSSPKSSPPVISGRPSPSIRIISNEFRTDIPAIFHVQTGYCRTGRVLPPSKPAARGTTRRAL